MKRLESLLIEYIEFLYEQKGIDFFDTEIEKKVLQMKLEELLNEAFPELTKKEIADFLSNDLTMEQIKKFLDDHVITKF